MRRQAHLETRFRLPPARAEVIDAHVDDWGLTPAERDVAMFAIKGFSISEMAELRGALLGLLFGDLIDAPLMSTADRATA